MGSVVHGWAGRSRTRAATPDGHAHGLRNRTEPDREWDGHYWHLVQHRETGKFRIVRDTQFARRGHEYIVCKTATERKTLEPELDWLRGI